MLSAFQNKVTHKPAVQYPALMVEFIDYIIKDNNDSNKVIYPLAVMNIIQRVAINKNNCYIAADAGNSFC